MYRWISGCMSGRMKACNAKTVFVSPILQRLGRRASIMMLMQHKNGMIPDIRHVNLNQDRQDGYF